MERVRIDDIALELEDAGAGEPVLLVHGNLVADALRPLAREPALAGHRVIVPRRRGYGRSGGAGRPASIARHAADCRAMLARLGVRRAHVVGHSSGGAIGLQLALDAPDLVGTIAVLEPAVVTGESGPGYRRALTQATERFRQVGARVAVDEFLAARSRPGYRELLERVLPGAFEQAVADARTSFESELPAVRGWRFGAPEARRIAVPVLALLGGESDALHPRFAEVHRLLLDWLPRAEGVVIPGATHFLPFEDPAALAGVLAGFIARHPLGG
jgi:pimeloyl-ACP methyl ester carboxylesterase